MFFVSAQAQVKLEYTVSYGAYGMKSMKNELANINAELKKIIPVDIAITDDFPGYMSHSGGVVYKMNRNEIGANFTYLTTAGRSAYSDYSGELLHKIGLNAYRIGLVYRNHFYQTSSSAKTKLSFFGELSPGMTFSKLETEGYIKIGQEQIPLDEKYVLNAHTSNFSILPQLGINLGLPAGLGFHVTAGYDLEMKGSLKQYNDVNVDWSGLRVGGGLSYLLPF